MPNWTDELDLSSTTISVPGGDWQAVTLNTWTLPGHHLWSLSLAIPPNEPGVYTRRVGPYRGAIYNLGTDPDPRKSLHLWVGRKLELRNPYGIEPPSTPGAYVLSIAPGGAQSNQFSFTDGKTILEVLRDLVARDSEVPNLTDLSQESQGRIRFDSGDVEFSRSSNLQAGDAVGTPSSGPSDRPAADSDTMRFVVTIGGSPSLLMVEPGFPLPVDTGEWSSDEGGRNPESAGTDSEAEAET